MIVVVKMKKTNMVLKKINILYSDKNNKDERIYEYDNDKPVDKNDKDERHDVNDKVEHSDKNDKDKCSSTKIKMIVV